MNDDAIRMRWLTEYSEIAEAKAMISHYEQMIDGWEQELDGAMSSMREYDEKDYAYEQEENGVPRYDEFVKITLASQGDYSHVDFDQLVNKNTIAHFLRMDANILLRSIKEEEE